MIRYNSYISNLNHIFVSDPSYTDAIPYRYNKYLFNGKCNYEIVINNDNGTLFFTIKIIKDKEFNNLINILNNTLVEIDDSLKIKEYDITVCTNSINIGINNNLHNIKTDNGSFGAIKEYYNSLNEIIGITFEGYFDNNYFNDEIKLMNILNEVFCIEEVGLNDR